MLNKVILHLVFVLMPMVCFTQEVIIWDKDRPLTWDDFQGKREIKKHSAYVLGRVEYKISSDTAGNIITDVQCKFFVKGSWKINDKQNAYLLKHEQNHFDIGEIAARKLRKAFYFYSRKHKFSKDTEHDLRRIYYKYAKEGWHQQRKYDRVTKHGKKPEKQKMWNQKISRQLRSLNRYEYKS